MSEYQTTDHMEKIFVEINYGFMSGLLASIGYHRDRHVESAHVAICWKYKGKSHTDLIDKFVVAVAYDKNKGRWDFPGGKNDCHFADSAVQVLVTMYRELHEELSVRITAPLDRFVLGILPCGRSGSNLLIVCGIYDLVAQLFKDEMNKKLAARHLYKSCYLEMVDFKYLGAKDSATLAESTSYVQQQHANALEMARNHRGRFAKFGDVMRFGD